MLTLYKSASSLESIQPLISASTSSPKSVDVATSSPTSAPVEASSCGLAHAFTPLPTVKVSPAMISLSVSLFSAIISSLSKTMKTLYSPSTMFVGIAPLIVIVWVALIANPPDHVVLPRLWSTQVFPLSTLRITSAMKGSERSSVPSLMTVTSNGTTSPGFAA